MIHGRGVRVGRRAVGADLGGAIAWVLGLRFLRLGPGDGMLDVGFVYKQVPAPNTVVAVGSAVMARAT